MKVEGRHALRTVHSLSRSPKVMPGPSIRHPKRNPNTRNQDEPDAAHFDDAVLHPDVLKDAGRHHPRVFRNHHVAFWESKKPRFYALSYRSEALPAERTLSGAELTARAFDNKMFTYVQLMTTPTADTSGTSLLLHFDSGRYIFGNISEGTQRAMVQRNIGLSKCEHVFVTGLVNWKNVGGLVGLVLTSADTVSAQNDALKEVNAAREAKGLTARFGDAMSQLKIHGGKNLTYFLASCRRFIFRKGLPLAVDEIRQDPQRRDQERNQADYEDINIRVWYVPVEATSNEQAISRKRDREDASASEEQREDDKRLLEGVVANMFNSDWQLDALCETTLYQVKLPAKIFMKDIHGKIQAYDGLLPGQAKDVPDIPVLVRNPWPAAKIGNMPRTEPARQSICYIAKTHDRRGKFDPKAASDLGVDRRDNKLLARGDNVTTAAGTVVTPEMVLGQAVKGLGFAVLDVPDSSYVEALINRPEWSNKKLMDGISVMYWLLGPQVAHDARLLEFMKRNEAIRHIVCSGDTGPNMIAMESVAVQAYRLHCIDRDRFPLPDFRNKPPSPNATPSFDFEVGRTGKRVKLAPQFLHEDDHIVPFPDLRRLADTSFNPKQWRQVMKLADQARETIATPEFRARVEEREADIPNRDAEVINLGTGSMAPSKFRNVSATLVRVPGYGNYLFDAGENTIGQMRRVFGAELPAVLRDLKAIWISHLHADHHLGTVSVIKAWHEETKVSKPEALLMLPSYHHMFDFLREYADVEDFGHDRLAKKRFFLDGDEGRERNCQPVKLSPGETTQFGVERIDACFVDHCHGAMAAVFTFPSGLKIAYSGDCRPSPYFAKIGNGATLLIHESTFDDELQRDAQMKKHSTMSEAISIGRQMGARRILLTHFSQRYQKVPSMDDNFTASPTGSPNASGRKVNAKDEVILVGFDYMRVKLGEFRKAQAFLPAIQKLLVFDKSE